MAATRWCCDNGCGCRGFDAEVVNITLDDPVPSTLDMYTLGGAEDYAQRLATRHLIRYPGLQEAAAKGAPVLAICAAIQVLGHWYETSAGERVDGVGLLDLTTSPQPRRTIGEVVSQPLLPGLTERLTGFENHRGGTVLGPDAQPLARVISGAGNREGDGVDGAVQGSVVATYLHGPCLARNPQLADHLLSRVVGDLPPLELPEVDLLRRERLAAPRRAVTRPRPWPATAPPGSSAITRITVQPERLKHSQPRDVLDILTSVFAVVIAVVLDRDHEFAPTHVEVRHRTSASRQNWNLCLRPREAVVLQAQPDSALARRLGPAIDQREQFAELAQAASAWIPLGHCQHVVDRVRLVPHQRVQPSQRVRPVKVPTQIECGAYPGGHGQSRLPCDLVVGYPLCARDQPVLRTDIHSEELDGHRWVHPRSTVQCRRRHPRDDSATT